jgi:ribosome-associated protein
MFTRAAHVAFRAGRIGRSLERTPPLTLYQETQPTTPGSQRSRPPALETEAPPLDGRLAQTLIESLEDAKAEDIVIIDLTGKTTIADLMIIATGRSNVHVGAIADRVARACRAAGFPSPRIEGVPHCDWVLLDAGDAIIHVFKPDVRQFYNLEKMWSADRPGDSRHARSS